MCHQLGHVVASRHSTKVPQHDEQQSRCVPRLVQERPHRRPLTVSARQRNIHRSLIPNFEAASYASLLVDLCIGVCQETVPFCLGIVNAAQCLCDSKQCSDAVRLIDEQASARGARAQHTKGTRLMR